MKHTFIVILAVLFSSSSFAKPGDAPHTRVTYPSAVSAEILGRGMLYSVNFEEVVSDDLGVGIGFSRVSTDRNDVDTGRSATMLPVFMSYYFSRTAGSMFVTGGADVVLN